MITEPDPMQRGKSTADGGNLPGGREANLRGKLDAVEVAKLRMPLAPVMIYGDDVTHADRGRHCLILSGGKP